MKSIINKQTSIQGAAESDEKVGYFELCKSCLNVPAEGGFDVITMSARLKVIDKLHGEEVSLEDAEYNTLRECVESMKWAIIHKDLVEFVEYIKEAVQEAPAKPQTPQKA